MVGSAGSGKPPHEIIAIGEKTQFGKDGGKSASEAGRKSPGGQSVRLALRRLMLAEVDVSKPMDARQLAKIFGNKGTIITAAQACALRKYQQAMQNWKAMDSLIDSVDGKAVQPVANATVTLADLVTASYNPEVLEKANAEEE